MVSKVSLVGIIIVIVIGAMIAGYNDQLMNALTGRAATSCVSTGEGMFCEDATFILKLSAEPCPEDTAEVCTNPCKLRNYIDSTDYFCQQSCTFYCVPEDLEETIKQL